jgi:DeoR/GlpR family transcriptional regulator of sugar metabolism
MDTGKVYATMISRAFQTMLAADRSKYGLKYPARFAHWGEIDYLMTDFTSPKKLSPTLERAGIKAPGLGTR